MAVQLTNDAQKKLLSFVTEIPGLVVDPKASYYEQTKAAGIATYQATALTKKLSSGGGMDQETRDRVIQKINENPDAAIASAREAIRKDPSILERANNDPSLIAKMMGVEDKPKPQTPVPPTASQQQTPSPPEKREKPPEPAVIVAGPTGRTGSDGKPERKIEVRPAAPTTQTEKKPPEQKPEQPTRQAEKSPEPATIPGGGAAPESKEMAPPPEKSPQLSEAQQELVGGTMASLITLSQNPNAQSLMQKAQADPEIGKALERATGIDLSEFSTGDGKPDPAALTTKLEQMAQDDPEKLAKIRDTADFLVKHPNILKKADENPQLINTLAMGVNGFSDVQNTLEEAQGGIFDTVINNLFGEGGLNGMFSGLSEIFTGLIDKISAIIGPIFEKVMGMFSGRGGSTVSAGNYPDATERTAAALRTTPASEQKFGVDGKPEPGAAPALQPDLTKKPESRQEDPAVPRNPEPSFTD